MTVCRQLLVRHRGLDPTAWTALHALARLARGGRPAALARAALWEFAWEGGPELDRRLADWVAAANWFANPNRDRATWRRSASDPTDLEAGAALACGGVGSAMPGAYLLTTCRGAPGAPEHQAAATQALGQAVRVRRGQVWWLAAAEGDASALLAAAGGAGGGGLLANPHSEIARLITAALPVPLLGDAAETKGPSSEPGGAR
jgi:hypothetical protein